MENLSYIVTVGISLAALISAIAVALINNHHQRKIRKLELSHDFEMRKLETDSELARKQFEITFQNKVSAFSNLIDLAGKFYLSPDDKELLSSLYSAIYIASIHCSRPDCRNSIAIFADVVSNHFYSESENDSESFKQQMDQLSYALDCELYNMDTVKEDSI
ncbi:MAG: hypothetical protein KH330_10090 [Clostridiales bacterium]|nr:hypothetical protein [Clostridiales bacterium]